MGYGTDISGVRRIILKAGNCKIRSGASRKNIVNAFDVNHFTVRSAAARVSPPGRASGKTITIGAKHSAQGVQVYFFKIFLPKCAKTVAKPLRICYNNKAFDEALWSSG